MIQLKINGVLYDVHVRENEMLRETLRRLGMYSVKCGCETSNCGLCTVLLDRKPVLSCSVLSFLCDGKEIETLEGLTEEAKIFGTYMALEGADQCGFCSPGFILNVIQLKRENIRGEAQIKERLKGNLCRCTGYFSQLRAIKNYIMECENGK